MVELSGGEIWLRQIGESEQAYAAFAVYRDMEQPRSLLRVAQQLSKSVSLLRRWSSGLRWQERIHAFDRYTERKRLHATVRAQVKASEKLVMMQTAAQGKIIEALANAETEGIPITLIVAALEKLYRLHRDTFLDAVITLQYLGSDDDEEETDEMLHLEVA